MGITQLEAFIIFTENLFFFFAVVQKTGKIRQELSLGQYHYKSCIVVPY